MKISNCCGVTPKSNGNGDLTEYGICPDCGEHCEYVDEDYFNDMEIIKANAKAIYANYPNLDFVNPEYRKYHGQIKQKDNE